VRRLFSFSWLVLLTFCPLEAGEVALFDAHIHYNHDAWSDLPPKEAVALLRKAGIKRALVSSSSDEGTQRLHAEAPDVIVPELRPYRKREDVSSWMRDDSAIPYLEERLARYKYVAIGEFHLHGADADLPVPRRMVELARQRNLMLHAHSDADAVERLFRQWPEARILWAHAGFEPPARVRELMRRYPNLRADLAVRSDVSADGKVDREWREAFIEFPDRFMVGTDTFTPERWRYVGEHAAWCRTWLPDLPFDIAERIAWRNGETLIVEGAVPRK
jgi:hypothetical protein